MAKVLEVIVTSVNDAMAAQAGGADRLELVRDLAAGGLTPDLGIVEEVLAAVAVPVRVMVRECASMSAGSGKQVSALLHRAEKFSRLAIDGMVAGFIKQKAVDLEALSLLAGAAPSCAITFHRAFDEIAEPETAIRELKQIPQVDRILTVGGAGDWEIRKQRLLAWQEMAAPEITILVGAGLASEVWADLRDGLALPEVHVGRAARRPQTVTGGVSKDAVRQLRNALS